MTKRLIGICSSCGRKKQIENKKQNLCSTCYARERKKNDPEFAKRQKENDKKQWLKRKVKSKEKLQQYERARYDFRQEQRKQRRESLRTICSIEGCEKLSYSNGMCRKHHYRNVRFGSPLDERICSVEGCNEPIAGHSLCKSHWYKLYLSTERGREVKRNNEQRRRARKANLECEKFYDNEIYQRDNFVCQLCGEPIDMALRYPHPLSPSLDHIIPISKNGSHTRNNTQAAHLLCNVKKSNRLPLYGA